MTTYCSFVAKFAVFVANTNPHLLTDEMHNDLLHKKPDQWKKYVREYYWIKPRPPSSMVKLSEISGIFSDWISNMKKKDQRDMSYSTYNLSLIFYFSFYHLWKTKW